MPNSIIVSISSNDIKQNRFSSSNKILKLIFQRQFNVQKYSVSADKQFVLLIHDINKVRKF